MVWSVEHRVFIVRQFFKNGESFVQTQRDFRTHYQIPHRGAIPGRNTILKWVTTFKRAGNVLKCKPQGRNRTMRTPENIERVRVDTMWSANRSVRLRAASLGMHKSTVRRILRNDLSFHPYKIQVCQELLPGNYQQRVNFSQLMIELMDNNDEMILFMSDEAHFHLSGYVNKRNCRYWSPTNPEILHQDPLHSPKVTVWCAVSPTTIIGHYFLQDDAGQTKTSNANRYVDMLTNFFFLELRRRRVSLRRTWFQQDEATSHTARISIEVLRQKFPGRLISRFGDIPWPPRSPDLTSCDFFLWGYLKSKVYINIREHFMN